MQIIQTPHVWVPPRGIIKPPKFEAAPTRWRGRKFPQTAVYGKGAGGGGGFSLSLKDAIGSADTLTTVDYGTRAYGSGNNALEIAILWYNTSHLDVVSSVSVGGSPASQVAGAAFAGADFTISGDLWQLNSPVGSSADIQVTFSGAVSYASAIGVYGLVSTTLTRNNANSAGGVAAPSASLTIPSGGGGIAFAGSNSGTTITWTNAAADSTITGPASGVLFSFGHVTASGTPSIVAATASDLVAMCEAAWSP